MQSLILASSILLGAIRAITPDPYGGNDQAWQWSRYREQMQVVTNGGAKVVFIGDSITHFWDSNGREQKRKYFSEGDYKVLNLGISADRTEHVIWRLTEGKELDGYEAKIVTLMIGTNNAGHFGFAKEPPSDAILGIRKILKIIREKQPKAKVVLMPIFPRGKDATDATRRRNDVVNREIMRFADGRDIFWCDFTDQMMCADGRLPVEIYPDYLHPQAFGYEIWAAALKPYVDAALSDGAIPMPLNRYASVVRPGQFRVSEPYAIFPATRIRSEGYGEFDWWLDRLERNRNEIAASDGHFDIVFFGDSITHNWEGPGREQYDILRRTYRILNIGYSGDCTNHLLWRGENGELDGYEAKCIMLMIGTNNAGNHGDRPEDTAEGVKRILELIARKQPKAKTLLLPIFPRGANAKDGKRVVNEKVNEIIKGYADGEKVIWVDFNAKFLDENGDTQWIMGDRLHPSADGYKNIWMPSVLPYFQKIVGK